MKLFPKKLTAALPVLLITVLLLLGSPLFGQATGSVTGIVADETGAVIPKAVVILTNQKDGTTRQTVSNGSGYFAFSALVPSTAYQLRISAQGFASWQSQPFPLRPGDEFPFKDIVLKVAATSAEVTVEAVGQAVKPLDSGERSDVISSSEIKTLAIVGRDATELVRMLPGFAMSSGDQGVNNKPGFNSAVVGLSGPTGSYSANGTGTNGISIVSDGASLTDIQTNAGSVQQINIDMVEEVKVLTSAYGADNPEGPSVVNAIGKSGSSAFHGSGYFHARDSSLNANDWYDNFLQQTRPDGRYLYPGANLGGPVLIPHTSFNKNRDKMFFFVGYENYRQKFQSATLGSWVPTMAERQGDFSLASLNAQLCGARPDGKANPNAILTMCQTMNYLPDGTAVSNGDVTAYANPSGRALLNWLPLPNADPFTNASGYNYIRQVIQQQNGSQLRGRIDYSFNDNNRLFLSYSRQAQIAEQPVMLGWLPTSSMLYPADVTTGDISNSFSVDYTRIFSPTLTNEFITAMTFVSQPGNMGNPAAVNRFDIGRFNCTDPAARANGTCGNQGFGNFNYLGQFKNAGDYSVPALADWGNYGYPQMLMPGGFYNNQVRMKKAVPNIQDTLSWVKGTHLIKTGFYAKKGILNGLADTGAYPQGQFSFNPGSGYFEWSSNVSTPARWVGCQNPDPAYQQRLSGASYLGNCMNANAMMYMGNADSYQQTNFSPVVNMQYNTIAGFVNDSWKIRRNLTLTLGARFEHIGPWTDRHGNGMAMFSKDLYNQQCDASIKRLDGYCGLEDMPGMTWHGKDHSVANSVNHTPTLYFTPRVGLAWDIFGKGNTVVRGGWGIFRSQEEFNPYALAASTAQGYKKSQITGPLTFDLIDSFSPNTADFNAYVISPTDDKRPVHYTYNFTITQRVPWHSLVEVAYVGSDNRNLQSNQTSYSDLNVLPVGALFPVNLGLLFPTGSTRDGTGTDIGNLNTASQDYFRNYSYYQHIYQLAHDFYSNYNSLQVSWNKWSGPVQFGVNYTFSKNLAVGYAGTPDPVNLRNDYGPVNYDRTHVFNVHYLVDLGTRYRGGKHLFATLMNGWQVSGISTVQSGPPLASQTGGNFYMWGGNIAATQVPETMAAAVNKSMISTCQNFYGIPTGLCLTYMGNSNWLGTPDVPLMPTVVCNPTTNLGEHQYVNPNCFGIPTIGQNGSYRLPYIHGPAFLNHDLSVLKNFKMGEKRNLQFRLSGFNFLNHPLVSFNKNDTSNLSLGYMNAVPGQALKADYLTHQNFGIANIKYGNRLVELTVKYEF